jgi:hypothetical protein
MISIRMFHPFVCAVFSLFHTYNHICYKTNKFISKIEYFTQITPYWRKLYNKFPFLAAGKIRVKLSLCLINEALCHEYIWKSGGIAPTFLTSVLDVGGWLTSGPAVLTQRKSPPVHRRLGGPQCLSALYGQEKNFAPAWNQTTVVHPIVHRYTDRVTSSWTLYLFRLEMSLLTWNEEVHRNQYYI